MTTAAEYVREQWVATRERYSETCTFHARRIAELLLAEGRAPWIGRIHETIVRGDTVFHGALIPTRYLGRGSHAWTTHYVACSGCDVYDPLAGEPVDVSEYAAEVFGRMLSIEVHLDTEATERLLQNGVEVCHAFDAALHAARAREMSGGICTSPSS